MVERNAHRLAIFTKKEAFEAWRQVCSTIDSIPFKSRADVVERGANMLQVVEVILTVCPTDLVDAELRQNVVIELLQELLAKVARDDATAELSNCVAGVVLTLMANLRHCFMADQATAADVSRVAQYVSMLDASQTTSMTAAPFRGSDGSGGRSLYRSTLQTVLRGMIEYLMRASELHFEYLKLFSCRLLRY